VVVYPFDECKQSSVKGLSTTPRNFAVIYILATEKGLLGSSYLPRLPVEISVHIYG